MELARQPHFTRRSQTTDISQGFQKSNGTDKDYNNSS